MWMNLHDLPAGKSMYTIAVTDFPADTPESERFYDEVDFVAPSSSTAAQVIERARLSGELEGYDDFRIVGVANQSDGYVMIQNWEGVE